MTFKRMGAKLSWNWETPDMKGFLAYAKEYYKRVDRLTCKIIVECGWPEDSWAQVYQAVFDKLASPLVYLYDSWLEMPIKEKAKYNPELAEIHKKSEAMVKEAWEKASKA